MRGAHGLLLLLLVLPVWTLAQVDLRPQLELRRGERLIRVIGNAPSAEGGRAILANRNCEEGLRMSIFYDPEPYLVETRVNEMLMTSRVVLERRPPGEEEEATLELFGAAITFDESTLCPNAIERDEAADVTIVEGRTTVRGSAFVYDNATGIGNLSGPVSLERTAEEGSEALTAQAETMQVNVDDDRTLLRGGVVVTSGARVSEADEFEYDEASGIAVLRGAPARSREGQDEVMGNVIRYDLNTNDVVVEGSVSGRIEVPGLESNP